MLDRTDRKFLDTLSKNHDVRLYAFAEGLQSVPGIGELEARGRTTALGTALERVLEEPDVKSRPTGGILLISDGKNTSGPLPENAALTAERRKIPIHAVGVGDPRALRDVELVALRADSVVLLEDDVVMDVKVRNRGYPSSSIELRIINAADGQILHTEPKTLLPTEDDQTFDLRYKPAREGDQQWIVEVKPLPGEHTTDNNPKRHDVSVRRSKLRVLYVDAFPRWEYRKLKNFLKRGVESFETQCILQSAQIDFIQEASPGLMPLRKFPSDEAELFKYDVIIFGDVDPEDTIHFAADPSLRRKILENIRKFVENGGGFAMIAGESFSPRAYKDTPLEDVLPIVIDPTEDTGGGADLNVTFKPKLTGLGQVHPIMQLVSDPDRNKAMWEKDNLRAEDLLPGFYWFARAKKEKPTALVLAVHPSETNDHGPYPLMVAGTYGRGPVFFCAVDEVWRWFTHGPKYSHQFWGNMVRYLGRARLYAGDKRYSLTVNRSRYEVGDRITLTAYVKEKDFRPSSKPEQEIVLKTPGGAGAEQRLLLKRVDDGVYEKSQIATEIGDYQAWILPEDTLSDEKISPGLVLGPALRHGAPRAHPRRGGHADDRFPDRRPLRAAGRDRLARRHARIRSGRGAAAPRVPRPPQGAVDRGRLPRAAHSRVADPEALPVPVEPDRLDLGRLQRLLVRSQGCSAERRALPCTRVIRECSATRERRLPGLHRGVSPANVVQRGAQGFSLHSRHPGMQCNAERRPSACIDGPSVRDAGESSCDTAAGHGRHDRRRGIGSSALRAA